MNKTEFPIFYKTALTLMMTTRMNIVAKLCYLPSTRITASKELLPTSSRALIANQISVRRGIVGTTNIRAAKNLEVKKFDEVLKAPSLI